MYRAISLLALLIVTPLFADDTETMPGMVSSSSAAYDGNALVLSGQVVLNHSLGRMEAQQAILEKQEHAAKEFPFSSIVLKNKVTVDLQGSSTLSCSSATFDFTELKGHLSSAGENGDVEYRDLLKRKNDETIVVELISKEADLFFNKIEKPSERSIFTLKALAATGGVFIRYGSLFTLKSGEAFYQNASLEGPLVQGTIQATPDEPTKWCLLEHAGDEIYSKAIDVDLSHTVVILQQAKGSLSSSSLRLVEKTQIVFSADKLLWDYPKHSLHLKGNAYIETSPFGTLSTDQELLLIQGKTGVRFIKSSGNTKLQFKENDHAPSQTLICHGKMTLDHEKMQGNLESPSEGGSVPFEKQIYYEEGKIALYADLATVDYAVTEGALTPSTVTLKGNIRLLSLDPGSRHALADWMTYSPRDRTLILGAHPGKKVLFFDEEQNVRISAKQVHLTREEEEKIDTIKGIGSVQFSFTAEEEQLLKSLFSMVP